MNGDYLKDKVRTVPHWPKQGIMFRDVTTLLKDDDGFRKSMDLMVKRYSNHKIDKVAGIESRGFIMGSVLAHQLGVGFIPLRKPGKLPAETISVEYSLEYGTDKMEIHKDAILPGEKILVVDDLIATGGTALAACHLIEKLGGEVAECAFVIDLPEIGGRKKLEDAGYKVFSLMEFEGE
ncbi:MAG: adenine phosphoribosyltransferase [Candidatus Woesearchaeota archaeon]